MSEIAGEAASRAAETMTELAERAAELAGRAAERGAEAAREARKTAEPMLRSAAAVAAERAGEARKNAEPVIRSAAEKAAANLSDAAERAAEMLADTAERLAQQGAEKAAGAGESAGKQLTKASRKLAKAAQPRKTHKLRNVVLIGGAIGGAAAVAMSPLGAKLRSMIPGQPPQEAEEPQSITLPVQPAATSGPTARTAADTTPNGQPGEGNGVLAGHPVQQGEEPAQGS
ncbi:MAG TPA: hypothetical protein VN193_13750 [Candidatus Angelobacter sp.]|nr:hypothetical protein [Candidatus Angelobacter sp.]